MYCCCSCSLSYLGNSRMISAAFGTSSCTYLRTSALPLVHFPFPQLCPLCIFWVIALQGNYLCVSCVALCLTQDISLGIVGILIVQLVASDLQASFLWLVPCTTIYFSLCLELESNEICGFYMESVVSQCMHVSLPCACNFYPLLFCSLLVPTSRCSMYLS